MGDTIASPRGLSSLQTLLANEAADEERSVGEIEPSGKRNDTGNGYSPDPVTAFWYS